MNSQAVATDSLHEVKVLHVDDDPDFAEMVGTFLEREDERFKVETTTSASDGLDRLSETSFDCIVSDYDMPHQNGIEFLKTVREYHPTIPFVLFTGKGSEEIASDAISAGVSDYLQKGPGTEQYSLLANRISNLVSQYRAETQLDVRAKQQSHVATLGQEALAGTNLGRLFDHAVAIITETLDTEFSKILEYRPDHDDLLLRAGIGWHDGLVGEATVGTGDDSQAGYTLRSEEPIVVKNLSTEDRFRGPPLLMDQGVVSGISVIIGSPDEPWGVLGTHTTEEREFSEDDINFVQSIGNVLANTIEQRGIETTLRDTRKWYQRIIDHLSDHVIILDETGEITYCSPPVERQLGYTPEEIVGRNAFEFAHPEDRDIAETAFEDTVANPGEEVSVEYRTRAKDGSYLWIEARGGNYLDDQIIEGIMVSIRDVTVRKENERALERAETIVEAIDDVAFVVGKDWTVEFVNSAIQKYVGVPINELEGQPVMGLADSYVVNENGATQFEEAITRSFESSSEGAETESPERLELTLDMEKGLVMFEYQFSPLIDDGDTAAVVITMREITERKEREQELEQTNALLSTLIETLPMGVLVEDASRNVLTVNERLFELFEMPGSPDEVIGANCERMAEEVSDAFVESENFVDRINELIAGHGSVRDEALSLQDGRTFARSYEPVELPGGDGHLWVYRDITDRLKRDQEREATVDFLARLHDVATDRTLDVNEKITKLLDLGPQQLGLPSGYLSRIDVYDQTPEGGTQRVIEASGDHELLQPGNSCPLSQTYCRKTIKGDELVAIPDAVEAGLEGDPAYERFKLGCYIGRRIMVNGELYGTVFFAAKSPRAEPFTDAERTFVQLMSKLVSYELERDSATSALEAKTEQLEEQYRTLFEEAPMMAVVTRAENGRPIIEDCNDQFAETVGYDHETLIGRELAEVYAPDSREELLDGGGYKRSLVGEFTREHRELQTADGEVVETLLRAVPRRNSDDEVIGTLAMYVDITEREQVKRANERLEEFTSIVSHDLRNPLNVAQGRLELAMEECESDHLDDAWEALDRSEALIEDLLKMAREGSRVSDIEPLDFGTIAEECWRTVATGEATIRIESDRTIRADNSRLRQLLENLYRNAIDHGGNDVTVAVGDLSNGFYVEDDGPGIPADERDEVVDPGYSTSEDGTGFGLSIVQQIAEAHGWEVGIAESETGGARIEFTGVEISPASA